MEAHPENNGKGNENDTIVIDRDLPPAPAPKPTVKDAQEADLSPQEIEMGRKSGLIVEEKPVDDKGGEKDPNEEEDAEGDHAVDKEKQAAAKKAAEDEAKKKKFEPKPWEKDIPDDEKQKLAGYNANETALYWKQKRDKWKRQQAEAERDHLKAQAAYWKGKAEAAAKASEDALKVIKAPAEAPKDGEDAAPDPFAEDAEKANGDKPLTRADLDRIEKEKAEKAEKAEAERKARVAEVSKMLDEQEFSFKEEHPDFDGVFKHTEDILDRVVDDKKLAELFPNKVQREGVRAMAQKLARAMAAPDKVPQGGETAAQLAYEIGQLHPKASDAGEDEESGKTGDEDQKNDLEDRLDKQGRPSSAGLSGGASRGPKSVKDLTMEDLAMMKPDAFAKLKKKHPDVVERILREG